MRIFVLRASKWSLFGSLLAILLVLNISGTFSTQIENSDEVEKMTFPGTGNPFLEWIHTIFGGTTTAKPELELVPPENCTACKCGLAQTRKRIVGGQETLVNQYPWMAMLLYSNRFYCGGSLINNAYVLTAAHCVKNFNPDRITVRLLEHDRKSSEESKIINMKVSRVEIYSGYSSNNYNNDIALIRLDSYVDLSEELYPVCMPETKETYAGSEGIVTGWGALAENGDISNTLQEVRVPIISNEECRMSGYGRSKITENMMCARFEGRDSCQGDSGGPLMIHVSQTSSVIHRQVGIVSWGNGCARPDYPGVYTRVNRYLEWLERNTRDACHCEVQDEGIEGMEEIDEVTEEKE